MNNITIPFFYYFILRYLSKLFVLCDTGMEQNISEWMMWCGSRVNRWTDYRFELYGRRHFNWWIVSQPRNGTEMFITHKHCYSRSLSPHVRVTAVMSEWEWIPFLCCTDGSYTSLWESIWEINLTESFKRERERVNMIATQAELFPKLFTFHP